MRTLAYWLGELHYLQDGLAQVRALLKRIGDTVSTAASSLEPQGDQSATLSIVERITTHAHDRGILWLLYRHRPIFAEAEADLHLPLHYWANALHAALDGSWDDCVRYLDAATGAHYLHAERTARPRWGFSHDEESFETLVQACRVADMNETLIYERMKPRADPEEYADQVRRIALADAQARAANAQDPHGDPGKRLVKVGRPKGRTSWPKDRDGESFDECFKRRVVLCNLWRENPTRYRKRADLWRGRPIVMWPQFVRLVDKSGQLASQCASHKSIIEATMDALSWGAPAPGVPFDPAQFVLG